MCTYQLLIILLNLLNKILIVIQILFSYFRSHYTLDEILPCNETHVLG